LTYALKREIIGERFKETGVEEKEEGVDISFFRSRGLGGFVGNRRRWMF